MFFVFRLHMDKLKMKNALSVITQHTLTKLLQKKLAYIVL